MRVITGKELFDSFSKISVSMGRLNHIAQGHIPCTKCGGSGWIEKPKPFLRCLLKFLGSRQKET